MPLLEEVGDLYVARFMTPAWNSFGDLKEPSKALGLFFVYAFERQGRNPSYSHAAQDAVSDSVNVKQLSAEQTWRAFQKNLQGEKLNVKLNPLFHEDDHRCMCVIDWLQQREGRHNIVYAAKAALETWETAVFRDELCQIRGTGGKISSFFLRDVALWFGIEPTAARVMLQPIDVWVARTVGMLGGPESPEAATQEWMVNHFEQPEKANAGVWYFGAQIAGSSLRLQQAERRPVCARRLVELHIEGLRAAADAWAALSHH